MCAPRSSSAGSNCGHPTIVIHCNLRGALNGVRIVKHVGAPQPGRPVGQYRNQMDNQDLGLLSTLAQAAAAVVAIVGGFLVSRILDHTAQRRRLQDQVQGLVRQRDLVQELLGKKQSKLLRMDAEEFLHAITPDVVQTLFANRRPDLSELVSRHGERGRSAAELRPFFERHQHSAARALSALIPVMANARSEKRPAPSLDELGPRGRFIPSLGRSRCGIT